MKKIFLTIGILAIVALSACEKEHDKGYYDNVERVYFGADSLNLSLGLADPTVDLHVFEFPVYKMGLPATRDMKYKITVVADKTNAVAGEDYVALEQEYVFPEGAMETVIPITLHKFNLREDEHVYQLTIKLEPTEDLELGAIEAREAIFTFNNFLEEPDWWSQMFPRYVKTYRPSMYAILIAAFGDDLIYEEGFVWTNYLQVMMVFKTDIYDYAIANPEYAEAEGWEFFDNLWWPYE